MATQERNDKGQFDAKMRDQDILKAFDFEATADDPYLTVKEVSAALANHWDINVTDEAVRHRLDQMCEEEMVAKRQFGPSVAYRALVGPELADDVKADIEAVADEYDDGESLSHDDLWDDLDP